jgi:hypothetical protein
MCISFRFVDQLSHVLRLSSLVILESYGFAIGANIAAPGHGIINHISADLTGILTYVYNKRVMSVFFEDKSHKCLTEITAS